MMNNVLFMRQAHPIKKAGLGVLSGTGAIISKAVWRELGRFDESYERGGEDTRLAEKMLSEGLAVMVEPTLAMHHAHGLGPINYARQFRQWLRTLKGPETLEHEALAARRPDLDFD